MSALVVLCVVFAFVFNPLCKHVCVLSVLCFFCVCLCRVRLGGLFCFFSVCCVVGCLCVCFVLRVWLCLFVLSCAMFAYACFRCVVLIVLFVVFAFVFKYVCFLFGGFALCLFAVIVPRPVRFPCLFTPMLFFMLHACCSLVMRCCVVAYLCCCVLDASCQLQLLFLCVLCCVIVCVCLFFIVLCLLMIVFAVLC